MKPKNILAIFMILPVMCLTGCWSSREINTLAITICIGIDKTENGYLLTEQVLNPKAIASQKATNESPVVLYTTEGKDIGEMTKRLTKQTSRIIYNTHLRMVVFGEDIAKDGIQDLLDYFARNYEYRTDFDFVVAKNTTAKNILSILTPLESIPGMEMYNSLKLSEENWASTKSMRMIALINAIIADGKNPVLTGIEISGDEIDLNSTDALKQSEQIKKLQYTSLAAFKKDKLAGWLNEDESKGYNYICGNVTNTAEYGSYGDKAKITFDVINTKSQMKASLINGKPAIDVEISVTQNIGTVEGEFDVTKPENKEILNEISEERIQSLCEQAVYKLQNELKTDIFGFGEAIHRKYPKLWEKIKDDWNNEFTELPVNITVRVKTNQFGQITKSFFSKETE